MHRILGIPNCYTLECNYNSSKYFNKLEEFGSFGYYYLVINKIVVDKDPLSEN